MANGSNPTAALRAAMRDLRSMFKGTLGDEVGKAALKTAIERVLSEVTGAAQTRGRQPTEPVPKSAGKPLAKKPAPAPKTGRKKAKSGPPSPGRLRQIAAMKEYWRKKKAEAEAKEEASGTTA